MKWRSSSSRAASRLKVQASVGGGLKVRRVRTAVGVLRVRPGKDELGGAVAGEGVGELLGGVEWLDGELAGGKVEEGEAEAGDGGDVAVGVGVEEAVLGDGAGGDDAGDLAADDRALLDGAGILHLVAERGGLAGADELREVGVERVVGDAAHRRYGALGERGAEDRGGDDGVLAEHLVEIAEAEHQNRAGRQFAFDGPILALHRCEFDIIHVVSVF